MRKVIAPTLFLLAMALARADQAIENVQQALKDQGFYNGEVTGENNADTTAAIRRFQIRHGLQITGELNDETLRSIQSSASSSSTPAATPPPSPTQDTSDLRDSPADAAVNTPVPAQPVNPPLQDRQLHPSNPESTPLVAGNLFIGTPYEKSSPEAQRSVVAAAQKALLRHGLYHNPVDGAFGANLEFSLRAYQSRVGLPVTGRLDLGTLAALALLPGANEPVYTPRRPVRRPAVEQPPVRGEWIHE